MYEIRQHSKSPPLVWDVVAETGDIVSAKEKRLELRKKHGPNIHFIITGRGYHPKKRVHPQQVGPVLSGLLGPRNTKRRTA